MRGVEALHRNQMALVPEGIFLLSSSFLYPYRGPGCLQCEKTAEKLFRLTEDSNFSQFLYPCILFPSSLLWRGLSICPQLFRAQTQDMLYRQSYFSTAVSYVRALCWGSLQWQAFAAALHWLHLIIFSFCSMYCLACRKLKVRPSGRPVPNTHTSKSTMVSKPYSPL